MKKQYRVGLFLMALMSAMFASAAPFLAQAQALQSPPSASSASMTSATNKTSPVTSPVTIEARDKEGLRYLIHAEEGINVNKTAQVVLLLKVTLIHFDTVGHVSGVTRADSLQVQQRSGKTSWLLQNVHGDALSPKPMQFQTKTSTLDVTGITLNLLITPVTEAKPRFLSNL